MAKVDTSMIDALAFYRLYTTPVGRPSTDRNNGREYHGTCPWCGGTDHFAFWESGRFSCAIRVSGCKRYGGDVIDFLTQYEGISFHEACDRLGVDPGSEYRRPVDALTWLEGDNAPPNKTWQTQASALVQVAQRCLYAPRGADALAYLHSRGLTDETIQRARLGYIPVNESGFWIEDTLENWGLSPEDYPEYSGDGQEIASKKVKLPEGILIPWYEGETIWKLNVRRLSNLRPGQGKYLPILGSGESLYHIDAITPGTTVLMCEGEFDALIAIQSLDASLAVVATGSAAHGRTQRAIHRLRQASCILVGFDNDEPDKNGIRAGERGAEYWIKNFSQARRIEPWAHDINDMLKEGMDLRVWLANELERYALLTEASATIPVPTPIVAQSPAVPDLGLACAWCRADATYLSADHTSFCSPACEAAFSALPPELALPQKTLTQEDVDQKLAVKRFKELEQVLTKYADDDVLPIRSLGRTTKRIMTKQNYLKELRQKISVGGDDLHQALIEINRKLVAHGGIAS